MSNQAITWALGINTGGPATKVLLIAIANYANEVNESYPSINRLAEETDQSPASVKRHLAKLIKMGLIVRTSRGGENGGRLTNRYALAMPEREVRAQIEPGVRAQFEGGLGSRLSPEPKEPKEDSLRSSSRSKRGTRIDPNFVPSQATREQMLRDHPGVNLRLEHAKFIDFWQAKTGANATKLDWDATWRNWIRNAYGTNGHPSATGRPAQPVPIYASAPPADPDTLPW